MATLPKWEFEAEYIQSCNCDWGCPCNFNALPTNGNCEALFAYRIRKGKYGSTSLDGVTFAEAAWWPKAIHQGNGVGRLYLDPSSTPEQRKALEEVFRGRAGGGVFAIFPKTWTTIHPTKVTKIDFHYGGYESWFKVEGVGEVHSEHIKNPITGDALEGSVVLPKGIAWKEALVTNIKRWWMHDDDLLARHEDRAGFATVLKVNQDGIVG